jgi:ABC-type multidrug transport system fused ATPase/permease subunit
VLGGVFLVIYSTSGVFLAALLPVVFLLVQMFVFQRSAGVDFLRIEGTTRAPVYSLFGEVLQGRSTIRAFKQETRLMARNIDLIRENAVPFFLGRAALSAWLVCWLNIIGTIATTAVAFFVIFSSGIVSPGDAGLALTSTSAITGARWPALDALTPPARVRRHLLRLHLCLAGL